MAKEDITRQGEIYEKNQIPSIRKSIGQYYTPDYIIKYILDKTVSKADIVENPFVKIIDPSCGPGYFLLEAYDMLKEKFLLNIEDLRSKYGDDLYILEEDGCKKKLSGKDYWVKANIHYHLLKHCIYGADKDGFAVDLSIEGLMNKEVDNKFKDLNIVNCDSLIRWENKKINPKGGLKEFNLTDKELIVLSKFWSNKFDYCVGNPPYIGHKQMDKDYKKWLLEEYKDVFRDKSDISFCFFNRIVDILAPEGLCGLITSRYFMESPTGERLRIFLRENTDIIEILDFYGADIFKGVGVATAIYLFKGYKDINNKINIYKLKDINYKFDNSTELDEVLKSDVFDNFLVDQIKLNNNRWILISDEAYKIYKKIESNARLRLKEIVNSFQGIITGCDKAFVLSPDDIIEEKIEGPLLKKWIKNKNIEKYYISKNDRYLIYSNIIIDPKDFPNAISFIDIHSERLKNRRECKNGIRMWYELQWGRDVTLFQQTKIIFPYKSKTNRFAIDSNNYYFSADVYGFTVKDKYKGSFPLEYLVGLLNSSVYEFYFKLFAKQVGNGIYDYYPNSLLDLNIIPDTIVVEIKDRVVKIMNLISKDLNNNFETHENIKIFKDEIDNIIMDYFEFTPIEREIILESIKI